MYYNTDYDYNAALFGEKIRVLREKKGLTQDTLAEKLDVNIRTIYNIETGKTKTAPRLDTVVKLCNVLNCDPSYLLTNTDYTKTIYKEIHDLTGLSEEAIKGIEAVYEQSREGQRYNDKYTNIEILNSLLSDGEQMRSDDDIITYHTINNFLGIIKGILTSDGKYIFYDHNLDIIPDEIANQIIIGKIPGGESNENNYIVNLDWRSNFQMIEKHAYYEKLKDYIKDFIKRIYQK